MHDERLKEQSNKRITSLLNTEDHGTYNTSDIAIGRSSKKPEKRVLHKTRPELCGETDRLSQPGNDRLLYTMVGSKFLKARDQTIDSDWSIKHEKRSNWSVSFYNEEIEYDRSNTEARAGGSRETKVACDKMI